jgi:hypothetical protein
MDDVAPYIFRTDDYGASWTRIADGSRGIPKHHFVRVIREDPVRRGLLFAGTEFGLSMSMDDGASWQPFQLDLPVTPITDMAITRGDLVVATQGRSFWILDDLGPLRQMTEEVIEADRHLFAPRDVIRWTDGSGGRGPWRDDAGENPPFGAIVHYLLPEPTENEEATEVLIEILDADGEVLRRMSSEKEEEQAPNVWRKLFPEFFDPPKLDARAGANRWVWNLRLADARIVDEAVLWGSAAGPMVPPGSYAVRMSVGDWTATEVFEVLPDPRQDLDADALDARYKLARQIWQELTRSHEIIERAVSVRSQVGAWSARIDDEDAAALADEIVDRLEGVESSIRQTELQSSQDMLNFPSKLDNQLVYLRSVVEAAPGFPTAASRERFAELVAELDEVEGTLDAILGDDVPRLESLLENAGEPRIGVK